jgi:hypothetical protein
MVSAALLSKVEGENPIPPGAELETQWDIWGNDRDNLKACVMVAEQRAIVIEALTPPAEY